MKRLFLCLVLSVLMLLSACGGAGDSGPAMVRSAGPLESVQASLPALPPAQPFNPARITAAFEATRLGSQAEQVSAGVTLQSGYAQFDTLADTLEWAVYRFDGVPADQVTDLAFALSNVSGGSQAWFALSDYQQQAWSFLAPQTSSGSIPLSFAPGQLTSPSGQIYVAVLAYDLSSFRLNSIGLSFANRQQVSGQVLDQNGDPIAGALVTTTLDENGVFSDGAGNFTLPAIPDGTWHLMAAKDSFVFFSNPQEITVAGATVSGIEFLGINNRSHFDNFQGPEPNDDPEQAAPWDGTGSQADSLSITDDIADCFSLQIDAPGEYYIKATFQPSVLFPTVSVLHGVGGNEQSSSWGQFGTLYVPLIAAQPGEFIVRTDLSGGGGTYTLELGSGPLRRMGGIVQDEEFLPGAYVGYVRIGIDDGLDQSTLLLQVGATEWRAWFLPQVYVVTPFDPDYTFNPLSQNVNLATGADLDVDFGVTSVGFSDLGESNNSEANATLVPLPWSESVGNLSVGADDPIDYYRVQPQAGNYLRVLVLLPQNTNVSARGGLEVSILDSALQESGRELIRPGILELRSQEPCDGNDYYIVLNTAEQRRFSYGFSFEEFSGHELNFAVSLDGQPLAGARIDAYSPTHGWLLQYRVQTAEDGTAALGCGLLAGEEVAVELFRYGMDFDRQTRRVLIGASDELISFDASAAASLDTFEPNSESAPQLLSLPAAISATVDSDSDKRDYYTLDITDNQPLKLSWDTGAAPFRLDLSASNSLADDIFETSASSGSLVFVPDAAGTTLWVSTRAAGVYNLQLEAVEAYVVSGAVQDGAAQPFADAGIYVLETGARAFTAADGTYLLPPLEPGDYNLVCYSPNHSAAPGVPLAISITDSSITQNFTLTYSNNDGGEPAEDDDSNFQARVLLDGAQFSGNLDAVNTVDPPDTEDWFRFDAAAPGILSIDCAVLQPWFSEGMYIQIFDAIGADVAVVEMEPAGTIPVAISLPVAGTYYFRLLGADGDYSFTINFPGST